MTENNPPQTHAQAVHSHWWWRPGWHQGRHFYTWHLTFEGEHDFQHLVSEYQAQLTHLPGVDLVPFEWLHLTMQGVGFTDEVPNTDLDQIITAVGHELAKLPSSLRLTFGRPIVRPEAIAIPPSPPEIVAKIRAAIRQGISTIWGVEHIPESATTFQPHVSLAYLDTESTSTPFIEAVEKVSPRPATIDASAAALIVLNRDDRMYKWHTRARVNIGQPPSRQPAL